MKTKLTITMDENLIPEAKRFARSQGKSLSQLVEEQVREAIDGSGPGFSQRWRGQFTAAGVDGDRAEFLAKKYLGTESS